MALSLDLPPPYAHQTRSLAKVRQAYRDGARAICLVLPCGAGKTVSATMLASGALSKNHRVLWIAHREELLDQAADSLRRITPDVGIVKAGRASNPSASIQIASQQTLHSRADSLPEDIGVVVSDECHHDKAETRQAILSRFTRTQLILGLTATPERGDRKPLGKSSGGVYEALVVGATVKELQQTLRPDGHPILVPFRVVGPSTYTKELFRAPLAGYLEFGRRQDGSFRPAIIFAASLEESRELAAAALRMGVRAAHVDGETHDDDRRRIFDRMRAGELDLLSNVLVATEGTDLPNVEIVGVARGCAAASTWIQMVMRAGRSCPATGKRDALLIDYRGHSYVHGLMEEDRQFSLEGKAIDRADALALRQCPTCGGVFEANDKPKCDVCGADLPRMKRRRAQVAHVDAVAIQRGNTATMAQKFEVWKQLRATASQRGYKPGWIGVQFKSRYGHWPSWGTGGRAA